MILADTSAWIDYLTGLETPVTQALDAAIGTSTLVMAIWFLLELLQGYRTGHALSELPDDLRLFPCATRARDVSGWKFHHSQVLVSEVSGGRFGWVTAPDLIRGPRQRPL